VRHADVPERRAAGERRLEADAAPGRRGVRERGERVEQRMQDRRRPPRAEPHETRARPSTQARRLISQTPAVPAVSSQCRPPAVHAAAPPPAGAMSTCRSGTRASTARATTAAWAAATTLDRTPVYLAAPATGSGAGPLAAARASERAAESRLARRRPIIRPLSASGRGTAITRAGPAPLPCRGHDTGDRANCDRPA